MSETTPPDAARGRIVVLCGCMFAGKTTRLIERLEAAAATRRILAVKHALDRRYDPSQLATHDARRLAARAVRDGGAIEQLVATEGPDVVGIDEAHFFGRPLAATCARLAAAGCGVIVAGLDHDAWGQDFPPFPELLKLADEVETLRAPCTVCGAPSPYSQRMVPVTDPTMVGGTGEYEPRCPAHFRPLPGPAPEYA
jgi:thymidine kinase